VAGTVVDGGSGLPIQGAQVAAVGTGQGAVTGGDGRFRVTRLPGTTVTLEVTTLGYRTATLDASVGDESVRIQLEETAVSLDGLVVTGTPAGERRRSLGNALASVDAAEVVAQAPVSNLSDLLRGRAAGVLVHTGSGMVGGGSQIRLRGVSSLSLFQEQPILYIDGVRVDNAIGTAGPQNQFPGQASNGGVMSRLDDLDPDEIERIEVIKGPAAATLFGTEASNGVIQVFTKKGSFGQRPADPHVPPGSELVPERRRTVAHLLLREPGEWGGRDPQPHRERAAPRQRCLPDGPCPGVLGQRPGRYRGPPLLPLPRLRQ